MDTEAQDIIRNLVLNKGVITSTVDGKLVVTCEIDTFNQRMKLEDYRNFINKNDNPEKPESNEDYSINLLPSVNIESVEELSAYVQSVNSKNFGFAKFNISIPNEYKIPREYIVSHLRDYPKALEDGKNLGNVFIS